MRRCDVLIVGGGPAGSTCARRLVRAGLDVCVVDKAEFPRDKTCAGWVTPPVLEALELATDDYPSELVLQPITGFVTGTIGGREVRSDYDHVVSYGIRRCEFDDFLLRRSGAELRLGTPLRQFERDGTEWIVNGELRAPLLVGAGGHFCPIARRLGAEDEETQPVVTAREVEFEAAPKALERGTVAASVPELFFCQDLGGYGWCFRKGNFLNIGLGRVDSKSVSQETDAFVEFLRERGKLAADVTGRFKGHAYRLYKRRPPNLVDDGVMLIGDSAGLAYPQSGEGIRPAVESALIAAEVALRANGRYDATTLDPYRERVLERFGTPASDGTADWLPASWLHFLAARLLETRWFSRKVVLDRWFLHTQQPALHSA